jgi:hypothetical protein
MEIWGPPAELITSAALKAALEEYVELNARLEKALDRADSLADQRSEAVHVDAEALTGALRRGEEDPGDPATAAIDGQIAEAQRLSLDPPFEVGG